MAEQERSSNVFLEPGQTVRWRGRRCRVVGEEEGGFLRLAGLDPGFKDLQLTPLLALERGEIQPDELPLPRIGTATWP